MKKSWVLGLALLGASEMVMAKATSQDDLMCRNKAKEIAAETYRGCITETRSGQIDQLKKDYQERLRAMKDQYQNDLKRVSTGGQSRASGAAAARTTAPKPTDNMADESMMDVPEPIPVGNVPVAGAGN